MKKLYRSIRNKLSSRAGETISETLISMLIASLALVMLAGAVSSAAAMITKSKDKLGDYYQENEKLVAVAPSASPSSPTIVIKEKNAPTSEDKLSDQSVQVVYVENRTFSNKTVVSYIKKP